ncbi:MAG: adenylate/guanylate cyclase domain-containing protein [Proteobacteria bacterium]|nr:adenylate/guanylate cyclase domain-containing protein [Pseudomonadota bacterium]
MPPANLDRQQRLRFAFAQEELRGLRLGLRARLVSLGLIALWIGIQNPFPDALYVWALLLGFILLGWLPYDHFRRGNDSSWPRYVYPSADMALLAFTLLFPNPLSSFGDYPAAVALRFGNEIYFFILIASTVFYYAPRVVLLAGVAAATAWSVGTIAIALQPDTIVFSPTEFGALLTREDQLAYLFQPAALNLGQLVTQVLVFLLVAGSLAVAARRTRALVFRHAEAERARSNLARHFSPNMVEELAAMDEPLGAGRSQDVGVLFADVVGFSGIAESSKPAEVLELLRELHAIMGRQVFAHDGTIDKYLGDGIMATFGTPRKGEHDAANALACARGILDDLAQWNETRAASGKPPIRLGVGIHYGPVVLGDIGDEHRLEFAVIGDTVNVASRAERLTRELGVDLVASGDLVEAIRKEGNDETLFQDMEEAPPQAIRGRAADLPIWTLSQATLAVS